jgi:glutaminyl-tRNA synthetase
MSTTAETGLSNFIADKIRADNASDKFGGRVLTRFPPEPNGYLHIGHVKSICLNFGLAKDFGAGCNLRFDDTNPAAEEQEYVDAIEADVRWLGFDWHGKHFASDYFDQIYLWAEKLVELGKAYVDESSAEQIAEYRGDFHRPGRPTPYRDRPVEENLRLLRAMRDGAFDEGKAVLRAKIDVNHPNMNLRDPVLYRVKKAHHHRTGDKWCIYPMYDYAHPLSDAIEGITHSICTLEFEDHRPFYDWCIHTLDTPYKPEQTEFARLKLTYTVLSKRRLLQLVNERLVDGWDDPRMPTIRGMRRRGVPPSALRELAARVGVSKADSWIDVSVLEGCIRDDLDATAPRAMAVIHALPVTLTNHQAFTATLQNHPKKPDMGSRQIALTPTIFVEREDFEETPPKGFFRLFPGNWVRLRGAGFVRVDSVTKDDQGAVTGLVATWAPPVEGNEGPGGAKVKGTIHWVPSDSPAVEVRLYDRLFTVEQPDGDAWKSHLNPNGKVVVTNARVEPSLANAAVGARYQFERVGYFAVDEVDSAPGRAVWNRVVTLKDSWSAKAKR